MKFLVENHRKYVCIAGILLSLYAYFIELMVEMNGSYNPYCEITARMNCTAAFASKYGVGFGIVGKIFGDRFFLNLPNCVYGCIYFVIQASGVFMNDEEITNRLFMLSFVGFISCIYLAFVLVYVIRSVCIVCVATYVLTYFTHSLNKKARRRYISKLKEPEKSKFWFFGRKYSHDSSSSK